MGYRRNRKTYHLTFEEFEGLEVTVRSVPVGELLDILKLLQETGQQPGQAQVRRLFGAFAKQIVSWTYEDEDGKPLPASVDTLMGEEFDFVLRLINAWTEAIAGTPPDPTTGTAGVQEGLIPASSPAGT
jgi:hypothetical protein